MATTTITWELLGFNPSSEPLNRAFGQGDPQFPSLAINADGHTFSTWTEDDGSQFPVGHVRTSNFASIAGEFAIDQSAGAQSDASVAALAGGGWVVTYTDFGTDPGGDIRATIFGEDFLPVANVLIADRTQDEERPVVIGLADGGFAVVYDRDFGADLDTVISIHEADGSQRLLTGNPAVRGVEAEAELSSRAPSIAQLANGNVVVAYEQTPAGGGSSSVHFRMFDAFATALGASVAIDTIGSVNRDIQVLALADGGFAVAYVDNTLDADNGISFRIYNANGSARTIGLLVANQDGTAGAQETPSLTQLDNGLIVVTWQDNGALRAQTFNTTGQFVGTNQLLVEDALDGVVAAFDGTKIALVYLSSRTDGSGTSIRLAQREAVREITGNGSNETLNGDMLRDTINGLGGNDTLRGFGNADVLDGGEGNDTLEGGTGDDEVSGGAGDDTILWAVRDGNDDVDGGDDFDTLIATGTDSADVFDISQDPQLTELLNVGPAGASEQVVLSGVETIRVNGLAGSDVLTYTVGNKQAKAIFDGGDGTDTLRVVTNNGRLILELENGFGLEAPSNVMNPFLFVINVEKIEYIGTDGSDFLHIRNPNALHQSIDFHAGAGHDIFDTLSKGIDVNLRTETWSSAALGLSGKITGVEEVRGSSETDSFVSGAANETFDAGLGTDVATFQGNWSQYLVTQSGDTVTVKDLRPGSPDGTDTLIDVEILKFSSGSAAIAKALRVAPTSTAIAAKAAKEGSAFSFNASASFADGNAVFGDKLSYSLTNAPGWLSINAATGVLSGTPGFADAASVRTVTVSAVDLTGQAVSQSIKLTVADTNRAPTNVTLSKATVAENLKAGTPVGTLGAVDPDGAAGSIFNLTSNPGGFFKIVGGTLQLARPLDFETAKNHTIKVQVRDPGGLTVTKAFTIAVENLVDVIKGTSKKDKLVGAKGADDISGRGGSDTIDGGAGSDILNGGNGADTLKGGSGKDTLLGMAGKDKLTGSKGPDSFVFKSLTDSPATKKARDVITDFNRKQGDIIDLKAIDAKTGKKNHAFNFIDDDTFSKTKGELRYNKQAKKTVVLGDVNGDGKADFAIELTKAIDLTSGDFVL